MLCDLIDAAFFFFLSHGIKEKSSEEDLFSFLNFALNIKLEIISHHGYD